MKTKRYFKSMVFTLAVSGMCIPNLAGALENSRIQPTYLIATEAQQAVQMAEREANVMDPSLQATLAPLQEAKGQMGYSQIAISNTEDQYVGMLSKMSGVSEKDINDMHTAGVAWNDIASELGIHVTTGQMTNNGQGSRESGQMIGSNGLQGEMDAEQMNSRDIGSIMVSRTAEIMAATDRNIESGWAQGHGIGMQTDVYDNPSGGMISGAGGLGNGMGTSDGEGHDSGMEGGMGASNSGESSGGSGGTGGSGGSSGGMGGGSSSGGGSGGHGGGGMM